MPQDAVSAGVSKRKYAIWVPFVAGVLATVVGWPIGKYTSAALGFQLPSLPAGMSTALYDGRLAGGIYGGLAAFMAGWVVIALGPRWPALRDWRLALGLSLLAGALFAALGAHFERIPPR